MVPILGPFGYNAWEFSGMDADEEEEDNSADLEAGDQEEEEGEDEDGIQRHKKKQFGFSKHYDAVALKVSRFWILLSQVARGKRDKSHNRYAYACITNDWNQSEVG